MKKAITLIFCMLLSVGGVFAQKKTVSGVVKDTHGEAVIGASVIEAGTMNGTATDYDGNFSIIVAENAVLQISSIGYVSVDVKTAGLTTLNVVLEDDAFMLEEVVTTAYGGKQLRSKVTNSIAKVSSETLSAGMHTNPASALSGAVAGLQVIQASGDPTSTPSITLRGGTSLNGSGDPLIIVDGVQRGSMADINPEDIESMEVLKDAGSTAIYGARAANGVILITTKRGSEGHSAISFNAKTSLNYYKNQYNFLNARDYLWWMRTAYARSSQIYQDANGNWVGTTNMNSLSGTQPYGTGNIYFNADGTPADGNKVTNANWSTMVYTPELAFLLNEGWETMKDPIYDQELIFKNFSLADVNIKSPSVSQDYTLGFQGGNDKGSYYASLGWNDSEGNATGNWYKRLSFTFNADYNIRKWLTSSSSFNFAHASQYAVTGDGEGTSYYNYFDRTLTLPPTFRGTNPDGEWLIGVRNVGDANVLAYMDALKRDDETDKFSMAQALTFHIVKGLDFKVSGNWYYYNNWYEYFNRDYRTGPNAWNRTRSTGNQYTRQLTQTYNAILTYNKTFNRDHNVSVMAGSEFYDFGQHGFSAAGQGAATDDFQDLSYANKGEGKISIDSNHSQNRILSFFGKADYDFKGKYLVSGVLRYDGYSRLSSATRWGLFPGISAGWVFSKEPWMESLSDVISFAKLRASYGGNGNLDTSVIGNYTVQGSYGTQTNYNGSTSILLTGLPLPALRWETSYTAEAGLDISFFQNRLNINTSFYNRHTMDKLASLTIPSHVGATGITSNNGEIRNLGAEIEISAKIIDTKDFKWNLGWNGAFNKNTIIKLPDNGLPNNRQNAYEVYTGNGDEKMWVGGYQEGQTPGDIYAFKALGIYKSYDEIPANLIDMTSGNNGSNGRYLYGPAAWEALGNAKGSGLPIQPGDVKWLDVNEDGIIDNYDLVKVGSTVPVIMGGFNTQIYWKGLTLSGRFDYALGHKVVDYRTPWIMGNMQGTFNTVDLVFDSWSEDNPNGKWPIYTWADQLGKRNYARNSSMFIFKGDYLAIRDITLAYSLPKVVTDFLKIQKFDVSVSGQNLGYITAAKTLYSPEYQRNSYAGWGGYKLPVSLIFGLNLTF